MKSDEVVGLAITFAIVSAAYAVSFLVVALMPFQFFWGDGVGNLSSAALVFLPHGVRVLVAWLYGWKSILLLAPSSYLMHIWLLDSDLLSFSTLLAPIFGVTCAAITFEVFERCGVKIYPRRNDSPSWRNVIVAGAIASVMNAVGTNLIYQNDVRTTVAYWIGDTLGMLVVLLCMMLFFRASRRHL